MSGITVTHTGHQRTERTCNTARRKRKRHHTKNETLDNAHPNDAGESGRCGHLHRACRADQGTERVLLPPTTKRGVAAAQTKEAPLSHPVQEGCAASQGVSAGLEVSGLVVAVFSDKEGEVLRPSVAVSSPAGVPCGEAGPLGQKGEPRPMSLALRVNSTTRQEASA
ncbi:hypothetical protein NDU88_001429 [Pleurodeles waltl]|uniref:Uncharacterized protein n=1 Tax=Pleurodeles waltl TaxID=8319 RepID=A0AAV7VWG1_PLEWA|nr:hypothetical protein NDU88_001429 [Pleurodeles waltl]